MFREHNLTGFSINNFRVFGKETSFKLAPLTILTGTNSSGKSSFTKALNLLTKSYKKNGLVKLEVMESELKLGGFKEIKNSKQNREEISYGLEIEIKGGGRSNTYNILLNYNSKGLTSLKIFNATPELLFFIERKIDSKKRKSNEKSFIKLPETVLNKSKLRNLFKGIPKSEFSVICNSILEYLQSSHEAHNLKLRSYSIEDIFYGNKLDIISGNLNPIIEALSLIGETESFEDIYYDEDLKKEIEYKGVQNYSVNPKFKDVLPDSILNIMDHIKCELFVADYLNRDKFKSIDLFPMDLLDGLFNRLVFIDGVRATQEIVYTKENSGSFYQLLDDAHEIILPYAKTDTILEKWAVDEFKLLKLNEGESFNDIFKIVQIAGYGYMVQIKNDKQQIGLSGLGYGVTQLLPILLQVGINRESIFIIEEPESNLHPALQSKLADFFVFALKSLNTMINPRFIIETHSEYLIRKLQYLTAKGDIKGENIQIYYFNHPNSIPDGEEHVKGININKDGSLTDGFGTGFFDEADNIALELFLFTQIQKN